MSARTLHIPKVPEVIDKIGLGLTHVRFISCGGGVWLADGIEMTLLVCLAKTYAADFNVGPFARGCIVTILFFGVCCGNVLSAPFGDRYGRRQMILASYLSMFIFAVMSSTVPSYFWFAFVCFCIGVSLGLGQPVWNTLISEVTPSFWRSITTAGATSFFALGEVFSYFIMWLDDPKLISLNWRLLLQEAAFPSFCFFVIALIWLLESPRFSLSNGKSAEAHETLRIMACDNFHPDMTVDFQVDESEFVNYQDQPYGAELKVLFSGDWQGTTIVIMYTCFVMNFVFNGALYAFPQVIPEITTHHDLTPAGILLLGALWELPAYAVAGVAALMYPRLPVMKSYLVLTTICVLLFAGGVRMTLAKEDIGGLMWHVGYFGTRSCIAFGYVAVYTYVAEVYPTSIRVSGCATAFATGRVGSMLASVVYEMLTSWTQTFTAFFFLCAILCVSNLCVIDFLPETFHASLLRYKMPDLKVDHGSGRREKIPNSNEGAPRCYGAAEHGTPDASELESSYFSEA